MKIAKGVIDVLKEESTREITVKVSPNGKKNKPRCQGERAEKRQRRDEQAKNEVQGVGLQLPKITPTCQSKQEAGCGPCWKQISLRAGA